MTVEANSKGGTRWARCDADPVAAPLREGDSSRPVGAEAGLAEPQLRAALGYYQLYPDEIEARLAREEAWTRERLRREHPALAARASR